MEQLASARELQRRHRSLASVGIRQRDVKQITRNALQALGVIRRRHRGAPRDWISDSLNALYGCRAAPIWHRMLVTEYEHALQVLLEAKDRYLGARSEWLQLQDSFNDIVVRCLFSFLESNGMGGHSRLVGRTGLLVKYGLLIAPDSPFDTAYPSIAERLRTIHNRRNTLPGSHPYDQRGGGRNRWLTAAERDLLSSNVRAAIDEISAIVEAIA